MLAAYYEMLRRIMSSRFLRKVIFLIILIILIFMILRLIVREES